jgi:hypothetical protein
MGGVCLAMNGQVNAGMRPSKQGQRVFVVARWLSGAQCTAQIASITHRTAAFAPIKP